MSRTSLARWLVAAVIGALVASALLLSSLASLRDQRDDRDLFLAATSEGWAEASAEFFRTPASAADLLQATMGEPAGELSLGNLLAAVQLDYDIDAAFVGRPDGRFLFAARSGDDGFRTRVVPGDSDSSPTTLVWLDADLTVQTTETEVDDYDPRIRPWYQPIQDGAPSAWSAPYTFSSSGEPGITYSTELRADDGTLAGVIGIDVRLAALNSFLDKLRPGATGQAAVIDDQGLLIASSGDVAITSDDLAGTQLPELIGTTEVFAFDDERTAAARQFGPDGTWTLIAIADNDDFVQGEDRTVALVARWLLIAVPTALVAGAVLRPISRRLRSLYHGATRDELTGISNRATITAELRKSLESRSLPVTVALVDLDGFKPINDTWGHQQGDLALRAAAQRLQSFADDRDMSLGRLGGDEFLVLAVGHAATETDEAWSKLVSSMSEPFALEAGTVRIGASVGVAEIPLGSERVHETALRRADRALYEVKRAGGGAWLRQEPGVDGSLDDMWNVDLRSELRSQT